MTAMTYALDESSRLIDDGRVLLGGSPLALFRLSEHGAGVLAAIAAGVPPPPNDAAGRLVSRLVDAGVLHPIPGPSPWGSDDVTVVIPVHQVSSAELTALLDRIEPVRVVVVVDDGSDPPVAEPARADVVLVRRACNGGPAAARNTGLAEVRTPLVAFVDADTVPEPGWLISLLSQLADPAVALAAPRVRSVPGQGWLARYETARSPLDLGAAPARVRARTRVAYLPAAAWLARTDVVRSVGGFDETMRVGEDVDLVWRLVESGHHVRYEPAATIGHQPRPNLEAWLRQRLGYGRSAGPLARRHAGALAPVGVSAWTAGAWLLAAAGLPLAGAGVGAGSALALARKIDRLRHPVSEALRIAGLGHLYAGRQLASAVTRAWWPLALGAALVSRRARRVVMLAAVAPAAMDWWHDAGRGDHDVPPAVYLALRVLDDAAYGAGVWLGAVQARTVDPLVPDLTSWPRPSRYDRTHRG